MQAPIYWGAALQSSLREPYSNRIEKTNGKICGARGKNYFRLMLTYNITYSIFGYMSGSPEYEEIVYRNGTARINPKTGKPVGWIPADVVFQHNAAEEERLNRLPKRSDSGTLQNEEDISELMGTKERAPGARHSSGHGQFMHRDIQERGGNLP